MSVTVHTPSISVQSGGELPKPESVSVSLGVNQDNAACTVTWTDDPGVGVGDELYIYATSNGSVGVGDIIFQGRVSATTRSAPPERYTVEGVDAMSLLRFPWGDEETREYVSQEDSEIIQNLIEAMGVDSSLTSIESSGWVLGVIEPVLLKKGEVPLSLIRRIDKLAGYATFTRSNGAIYRRQRGGGGGTEYTGGNSGTIIRASLKRSDREGTPFNRCLVKGLSIGGIPVEGEYSRGSSVIPDPPGSVTEDINDSLVEDNIKANEVAQMLVEEADRIYEEVSLTVVGDPDVQPGGGITVSLSNPAISGGFWVTTVRHNWSAQGFTTDITGINL